jgi:hypothetical protein
MDSRVEIGDPMSQIPSIPGVEQRASTPPWIPALETVGLTGLAILVGVLFDRNDPFLLRHAFPWLALAPLLVGLRHGSGKGLASGALLVAALGLARYWGLALPPTVVESVFGWIALGLLAGEFADAWQRRHQRLETGAHDIRRRLESLSREHHALLTSHERLRRQVPGEPSSFYEGLEALSAKLARRGSEGLSSLAGEILAFFAEHASVQSASLHAIGPDGRPGAQLALLGAGGGSPDDALLAAAVEHGEVVSVRELGQGSDLLAAVPLVDTDHRVHAVIAVRDMPFLALDNAALIAFAVAGGCLGGALGGALGGGSRTPVVPAEVPERRLKAVIDGRPSQEVA